MKRRYLYGLITILIGFALYWTKCKQTTESIIPNSSEKSLDLGSTRQAKQIDLGQPLTRLEKLRSFFQNGDTRMDFYGRVIDQDGQGVAGATINYLETRVGILMVDGRIADNNQRKTCISSSDGIFSIKGAKGFTLSIELIQKEGYRENEMNIRNFGYRGTPELHNADEKKPVDFLMIRDDVPKATRLLDKNLSFSWNQGPVEVPISGVGKFIILPKRDRQSGQLEGFDWKVDISMEGAEMLEIKNGEINMAPIAGYQKSFNYGGKKDDTPWAGGIQQRYAFKTNGGLYGYINFSLSADNDDGEQFTTFEVRLNETGSRSLD